nr:uncharacterized protein LOC111517730 [Leptinotarsa decemlineata]
MGRGTYEVCSKDENGFKLSQLFLLLFCCRCIDMSDRGSSAHKIQEVRISLCDGKGSNVEVAEPDDSEGQKWILECNQKGHFIINSERQDLAMDIQKGCKIGQNVMVYGKHSRQNQQFFINSDATIGTACNANLILLVKDRNVEVAPRDNSTDLDIHFEIEPIE